MNCSVAAFDGGRCVVSKRVREESRHLHAEQLLPLIDAVVQEANWAKTDLDAVAVSSGPGSYTGLRIGVSTAKGICHALGIPLLALDTLELLGQSAKEAIAESGGSAVVWPVLDARRMEVYVRPFIVQDDQWVAESPALPVDLEQQEIPGTGTASAALICVGDAVDKVARVYRHENVRFILAEPDASLAGDLIARAEEVDLAYFEPRYLKAFQAGAPKDPLGLRAAALDPPPHA